MPASLPVVDISPFLLQSTPAARAACASAVHNACLQFGFLYINGFESVVSHKELDASIAVARAFFNTPAEEKQKLRIRPGDGARGYQLLGENVTQYKADHHEGLDLYRPVSPEDPTKLLQGPNQWPVDPPEFRPTIETWVEKLSKIGMALMKATAMGLGMDLEGEEWKGLKASVEDSFWVLRAIYYPPLPPDAPGVSCGAHKDYGCWTLLHTDPTEGALQVFLGDEYGESEEGGRRGTWLNANPLPNSFVVNIGEMWEIWSNGLYKSTLHRVLHQGTNYRVSLPFFYEPAFSALIEPLPSALRLQATIEGQDTSSEARRKPVVYGEFLAGKVSGNFALVDEK